MQLNIGVLGAYVSICGRNWWYERMKLGQRTERRGVHWGCAENKNSARVSFQTSADHLVYKTEYKVQGGGEMLLLYI